jgi:hypothetical protein
MTSLLDQHAPWSISKSDLAAKCSLAFHLRYSDRLERLEGTEAKIGTAAHTAQEFALKGDDPKVALAKSLAKHTELTSKETEVVESLLSAYAGYAERIKRFKERKGVVEELVEQKWALDRSFKAVPWDDPTVFFRGVVDYAMLTGDGYMLVHDHKSGRERPVSYYQKQLDSYAVLALAQRPDVKGVQGALHFMKTKNIVWHTMRDATSIRNMLQPWLIEMLTQRANKLAQRTPTVSPLCKWCDYRDHCPDGRAFIEAGELAKKAARKKKRSP